VGKSAGAVAGASADAGAGTYTGSPVPQKPNIVFVLTDDLSWNLVRYMPHVLQMEKAGTTFSNFFATDSQCCPSRSSIFTGEYPHNTGVFTNVAPDGGYDAFVKNGDERKCFAPALQSAGYRTGFMGKYLNGYKTKPGNPGRVPSGWNEWDATGGAYKEFNYSLNENGKAVSYGHRPKDYLTDVLSAKATSFVDTSAQAKKPFMLEVSTFAPHSPFVPAPRDKHKFRGITAPRTGAYGRPSTPAPKWQSGLTPLTAKDQKQIDHKFGKRVRSVQAVDEMIGHLYSRLQAKGLARNTYFMFASDNGLHMGEHRLRSGKQTAYDTDIKVPLIVTGPGVPLGAQVSQLTENVDLNPTFQELAGVKPPGSVDGQSLVPLIHGHPEDDWRQAVLIEHHHSASKKGDPDAAPKNAGDPPSYEAIRTADAVYIEYVDGEREYYALKSDPDELRNLAPSLSADQRASLHKTLTALEHCKGSSACRAAARTKT
jgi:N-acetylglucosamine-6-sulfatase